jgi:pyridoxal phosphate enzyme (YggS family)
MSIKENLLKLNQTLGSVNLLAVTKYVSLEQTQELINCGQTMLGESRVQDALKKYEFFQGQNIEWHMIGHLQTNKAKQAVKIFDYIQSVDSLRIAEALNTEAQKISKTQKILIQINIGQETQKSGIMPKFTQELVNKVLELKNLELCGLMAIVPDVDDPEKARPYFKEMKSIFDGIKSANPELKKFQYLSMGMSHDYLVAISEGATMVRIGSALFA